VSPAGPAAESEPSRAEQRAREKAEWAEHDALIKRLGVLWPNYGCFCGTLEDLRETVADLERRAARDRPNHRSSSRDQSAAQQLSADRAGHEDPQATARLAVARAQQRLAIAAAVVAHLLYLLATDDPAQPETVPQPVVFDAAPVQHTSVQSALFTASNVQLESLPGGVQPPPDGAGAAADPRVSGDPSVEASPPRAAPSPARDRAEAAATRHAQRHGAWPTVTELEAGAEVSRGTAAAALKALREQPLPLHLINTADPDATDEAQP